MPFPGTFFPFLFHFIPHLYTLMTILTPKGYSPETTIDIRLDETVPVVHGKNMNM
jgi:hypothetical protein